MVKLMHKGVDVEIAVSILVEEHGYVARKPHPTDTRGKLVLLTRKGWDCIQAVEAILARIEGRWTELLGSEHMKMLNVDLQRLINVSESAIVSYRLRPMW